MSEFHDLRRSMGIGATGFARLAGVGVNTVHHWDRVETIKAPKWALLLLETWRAYPMTLELARKRAEDWK